MDKKLLIGLFGMFVLFSILLSNIAFATDYSNEWGTHTSGIKEDSTINIKEVSWIQNLWNNLFSTITHNEPGVFNINDKIVVYNLATITQSCYSWGGGTYVFEVYDSSGLRSDKSSEKSMGTLLGGNKIYEASINLYPDKSGVWDVTSYIRCGSTIISKDIVHWKYTVGTPASSCTNKCLYLNERKCSGTNGYMVCKTGTDGCFDWGSITQCASGSTCANGYCSTAPTCGASPCVGAISKPYPTCWDTSTCTQPPVTPTCNNNGVCDSGETVVACPNDNCGTTPPVTNERDLSGLTIYDLNIGNVDGTKITEIKAGQKIKINFKLKSNIDVTAPYLIEAGIIPKEVAINWGISNPVGLYSLFALIKEDNADACCLDQPNVADNFIDMNQWYQVNYGTSSNSITNLLKAYYGGTLTLITGVADMWLKKDIVKEFEYTFQVPDEKTKDLCYDNQYWNTNSTYTIYVTARNGCYKDGYLHGSYITQDVKVNTNVSSNVGRDCTADYMCTGVGETCDLTTKKCISCIGCGGPPSPNNTTGKSLSLTYTEWKDTTAYQRLLTLCKTKDDCSLYEDLENTDKEYKIKCSGDAKLLAQLKEDAKNICTEQRQNAPWYNKLKDNVIFIAGTSTTGGLVGGALGCGVGGLLGSLGFVVGGPVGFGTVVWGCQSFALGGAAIGAGLTGAVATTISATGYSAGLVCSSAGDTIVTQGACIASSGGFDFSWFSESTNLFGVDIPNFVFIIVGFVILFLILKPRSS